MSKWVSNKKGGECIWFTGFRTGISGEPLPTRLWTSGFYKMRGTYLAAVSLSTTRTSWNSTIQLLMCQGVWWQSSTAGQLTAVLDCKTSHAPGFMCLFGQNEQWLLPSPCLSAWYTATPTRRIFVKFHICAFWIRTIIVFSWIQLFPLLIEPHVPAKCKLSSGYKRIRKVIYNFSKISRHFPILIKISYRHFTWRLTCTTSQWSL